MHPWDKKNHPFNFVEVEDSEPKLGGIEATRHSKENWYHPEWVETDNIPNIYLVPNPPKESF